MGKARKYCEKHEIWYDYDDTCPECTKFGRIAGNIIGGSIFAVGWAGKKIYDKIKEENIKNKKQKELELTKVSATINNIWQEHNVFNADVKGMNIHIKFQVNNMLNLKGSCNAYFYDKKGKVLKDKNQNYYTVEGQVSTWDFFTPNYVNCVYNDFILFIPYNELHIIGHHDVKFKIMIFDNNNQCIAYSDYNNFNINWQEEGNDNNKKKKEIEITNTQYEKHEVLINYISEEIAKDKETELKAKLFTGRQISFDDCNYLLDTTDDLEIWKTICRNYIQQKIYPPLNILENWETEYVMDYNDMIFRIILSCVEINNTWVVLSFEFLKDVIVFSENIDAMICISNVDEQRLKLNNTNINTQLLEQIKVLADKQYLKLKKHH